MIDIVRALHDIFPGTGMRKIEAIGQQRYANEWHITMREKEDAQYLVGRSKVIVKEQVGYIGGLGTQTHKIRVHWAPYRLQAKVLAQAIIDNLPVGAKLLSLIYESLNIPALDYIKTETRTGVINYCGAPENLPHLLKVQQGREEFEILITIPGRAPLCLRCKQMGHRRNSCTTDMRNYARVSAGNDKEEEDVQDPEGMDTHDTNEQEAKSQEMNDNNGISKTSDNSPKANEWSVTDVQNRTEWEKKWNDPEEKELRKKRQEERDRELARQLREEQERELAKQVEVERKKREEQDKPVINLVVEGTKKKKEEGKKEEDMEEEEEGEKEEEEKVEGAAAQEDKRDIPAEFQDEDEEEYTESETGDLVIDLDKDSEEDSDHERDDFDEVPEVEFPDAQQPVSQGWDMTPKIQNSMTESQESVISVVPSTREMIPPGQRTPQHDSGDPVVQATLEELQREIQSTPGSLPGKLSGLMLDAGLHSKIPSTPGST